MRKSRGFTLIELMVVITILAIILAIAIPAYRDQVRKSRRAEAVSGLGQWQLQLERWRADRPSYGNPAALAGYPAAPTSDYYTFTIPAAPTGPQDDDPCGTFVLVMAGGVATKTADQDGCW